MLDARDKATLITRPRRFGKSLMFSTMEEFFTIRNDKEETRRLFDGLKIMKRENLVEEYMASYPVLRFSFNGVTELNYSQLIKNILIKMQEGCLDNISTFDFSKCAKSDVACYDRLQLGIACSEYKDPDTGMELKTSDMQRFLSVVIRMLYNFYGKKVIVLLDEYDVPLAKASVMDELVDIGNGKHASAYTAMKQFMASF